jgi:hypothetical protein
MIRWILSRINFWVILGGVLVAGGLIVLFGLLILWMPVPASQAAGPQAALTVIVAPSLTPSPTMPLYTPTPTPPPSVDGISIGTFVQITGTSGQGLRIRSGPGTSNPSRFVAMDSEVFQVKEGPKVSDGFTWWHLEAPYDPERSGWAASKYLQMINPTAVPQ